MFSVAMENADELKKMKPQNLNDTSACAPPDEKWHYAIFLCICCLWLCVGMNNASVTWTLKDIADSQLLDLRQEGVLASGFAMGYCFGPVTMGILLDKMGRRPTLLLCCIVPSVCQAAAAYLVRVPVLAQPGSWPFTMALAYLRCCQAICSGGATVSSKVYLNEIMPIKCRDAMLSIVHIQLQLGGMALTVCALFWPKWQQLHAILMVPGLVTTLLMLSPKLCPESLTLVPKGTHSRPFRELLQTPHRTVLLVLVLNQFFHRICQQGNDAWGMKFLQTIGKRETRTVVSNVKFVCKILGGLLAASASKHLGTLAAVLGGYMTCAVGTLLFTMTQQKMSLAVAWGVAYLGEEVANVLAMTTLVQAFPMQLRGRGVSLVCAPNALAGIVAGSLGALSAYYATVPFVVNAASMVISGLVLLHFSDLIYQKSQDGLKQD